MKKFDNLNKDEFDIVLDRIMKVGKEITDISWEMIRLQNKYKEMINEKNKM